jgi:hypothetical protein
MNNITKQIATDNFIKFKKNITKIELSLENIRIIGYSIFSKILYYNSDNSYKFLLLFCKCCYVSKLDFTNFFCFYNSLNNIIKDERFNKKIRKLSKKIRNILYYTNIASILVSDNSINIFIKKLQDYEKAFFLGFNFVNKLIKNNKTESEIIIDGTCIVSKVNVQQWNDTHSQEILNRLLCFVNRFSIKYVHDHMSIQLVTINEYNNMKYEEKVQYFIDVHNDFALFISKVINIKNKIISYHEQLLDIIRKKNMNYENIQGDVSTEVIISEQNDNNILIDLYINDKVDKDYVINKLIKN